MTGVLLVLLVVGGIAATYFWRPKPPVEAIEVPEPTMAEQIVPKPTLPEPVVEPPPAVITPEAIVPTPPPVPVPTPPPAPTPVEQAIEVSPETTTTQEAIAVAEEQVAAAGDDIEALQELAGATIQPYLDHPISYADVPEDASAAEAGMALTADAFKWQEAQRVALGLKEWEVGYPMVWWSATIQYADLHGISITEAYYKRTGYTYPMMAR